MRRALQTVSWLSLAATVVPAMLYVAGTLPIESMKGWMLAGTIAWFATAPLWMDRG